MLFISTEKELQNSLTINRLPHLFTLFRDEGRKLHGTRGKRKTEFNYKASEKLTWWLFKKGCFLPLISKQPFIYQEA